jgi:hypothetical protein
MSSGALQRLHEVQWCRVAVTRPDGTVAGAWVWEGVESPDLDAVDMLARCTLDARRRGLMLVATEMCEELRSLLDLTGLLGQVGGEAEHRE